MASPESIIVEHYKAIREEEMERLKHRDRYIVWFITITAGSFGVFTKDQEWWGLLAVVPFMGFVLGAMYAHTDVTLGALSHFLRHTYTDIIEDYRNTANITYDLPHWDGSDIHKQYLGGLAFAIRYFVVSAVVLSVGLFCNILIHESIKIKAPDLFWIILCFEFLFISLGTALPIWAWILRKKDSKTAPSKVNPADKKNRGAD